MASAEEPFWRAKAKAYERIKNGDILVSVVALKTPLAEAQYKLTASGGGRVEATRAFVYATALDFERAARASDYVKAVTFDRKKGEITLDLRAFGRSAQFVIEVLAHQEAEPWRLDFKIKDGPLSGMLGQVSFTGVEKACEVGFSASYKYDSFPAPKLFLEFGFEVVLQRMAARLRAYAEDEWRRQHKVDSH